MSFPRYPEYKDSGDAALGLIPSHWRVARIGDVAKLVNGYPFDSALFHDDGAHPLIRIRDLGVSETATRYNGDFVEAAAVTSSDVLIGMDGDFNVGRWLGTGTALLNQRMCCIRTSNPELTKLLEYALPQPLRVINDLTYATTVKHLSSSQVEKIRLGLAPDRDELSAIVGFLDHETAKIDALVAEQEKLIALLQEKRQAVISHAVTKGLSPNAPMKDSGVEWLGEVPAHWDMKRVKDCGCEIVDCKNRTPEPHDEGNYFVVRTSCVKDGQFNPEPGYWTDEANFIEWTAKGRPQAGDVLFTREAPTGEACLAPEGLDFCLGQRMMYIRPPKQVLLGEFLLYSIYGGLARERISEKSKGSTVGHLRVGEVGELPLLLPPLYEQVALIAFVGEELSKLQALAAASESAIALMKERRTALISAAVTGQIDVRGWMPADAASNFLAASAGAESVGG